MAVSQLAGNAREEIKQIGKIHFSASLRVLGQVPGLTHIH